MLSYNNTLIIIKITIKPTFNKHTKTPIYTSL